MGKRSFEIFEFVFPFFWPQMALHVRFVATSRCAPVAAVAAGLWNTTTQPHIEVALTRCTVGPERADRESFSKIFAKFSKFSKFFAVLGRIRLKNQIRDVEICLLSKFQLPASLGGPKNAKKQKRKNRKFWEL